jgi:hypothetical protein
VYAGAPRRRLAVAAALDFGRIAVLEGARSALLQADRTRKPPPTKAIGLGDADERPVLGAS